MVVWEGLRGSGEIIKSHITQILHKMQRTTKKICDRKNEKMACFPKVLADCTLHALYEKKQQKLLIIVRLTK